MGVYIKGMEMPTSCTDCRFLVDGWCYAALPGSKEERIRTSFYCPLIELPPHGDLIDRDALIADLRRQCKEVFKTDAVSPDDFWITRSQAYNERLWTTWCESLFDYLKTAPTIIEAEGGDAQ